MYTREELADQLTARREHLMQRAEELREEFADRVDEDTVSNLVGWTLIGTGVSWGITKWMRGSRRFMSLFLPISLIAMGSAVITGAAAWHRRSAGIEAAEQRVREELSSLDPFARLRVLRDAAEESVPFVRHINIRN